MRNQFRSRPSIALLITACARLALAAPPGSVPASAPAAPLARPAVLRIGVALGEGSRPGEYWLRMPAGYGAGERPVLLICLHGTDDTAEQMIAFWSARTTPVPVLLAAPQGLGLGWSETDLPAIRAMMADLQKRFEYDPTRVLLVGFSAGGAMTFELLYRQGVPATAAAALANYLPPHITEEEVAARKHIPVFYAVGMSDINQERMRVGLDFLRSAGANVEIHRPRIGHTLAPDVAQAAIDWFFERCRQSIDARIDQASSEADVAAGAERLQELVEQSRWHEPAQAAKARQRLERLEAPGQADLRTAEGLRSIGKQADAAELLHKIENAYGASRLAREARRRREAIEADPAIAQEVARRRRQARTDQAQTLFAAAQRAIAQSRPTEAIENCRRIVSEYGDTPMAARARHLLDLLQPRSAR